MFGLNIEASSDGRGLLLDYLCSGSPLLAEGAAEPELEPGYSCSYGEAPYVAPRAEL